MHKMMQLRDKLMDELEMFADKPITEQNLEYIDKLAHAIKCIDTVDAMEYQVLVRQRIKQFRPFRYTCP